jgi:hypothetical protein
MSLLPEFSFDSSVQPVALKHDKLTMSVRHRVYEGTGTQFAQFRNHLCVPPQHQQRNPSALNSGQWGRIFARGNNSRFSIPLESRKASTPDLPAPVFNCKYCFIGGGSSAPDQKLRLETKLQLWPNVTGFIRNQHPQSYIPPRRNFSNSSADFYEVRAVDQGDEYSLDGKHNWIPDLPQFVRLHDPWFCDRNLRTYLNGTIQEIDADTARAADLETVNLRYYDIQLSDKFSLSEAETYIDFAAPKPPVELVRSFEQPLESYNELQKTAKDYPCDARAGWRESSRVLTIPIREGVKLKIYAKTNKRIRFEVTHNLREAKFGVGAKAKKQPITAPNLSSMYAILALVRMDSSEIINGVIGHMRGCNALPATAKTPVDLLFDIVHAVKSSEHARTIVSVLLNKGSITSRGPLTASIGELRAAGILRPQQRNGKREHVVTEKYQHPLKMLLAVSALPHLTSHHRTRPYPRAESAEFLKPVPTSPSEPPSRNRLHRICFRT